MKAFVFTKLARAAVLAAVFAAGAASAGEGLFYNPGGAGGSGAARLGYDGNVFKQRNDMVSEGLSEYGATPNFHFTLRYYLVANFKVWGVGGDFVFLMPNGSFHGVDIGMVFAIPKLSEYTIKLVQDFGGGYSYGYELELSSNAQIIMGGSAGLWMTMHIEFDDVAKMDPIVDLRYNFIGPFAGFRVGPVELMYRALMGVSISEVLAEDGRKTKFAATHRISLGYCFGRDPK